MLKQILGESWRTSLSGYLSAIALAVIPFLETDQISFEGLGIAAAVAILGRFAKDHNVSGTG